jgi:hypothetical protein
MVLLTISVIPTKAQQNIETHCGWFQVSSAYTLSLYLPKRSHTQTAFLVFPVKFATVGLG